MDFSDIRILVVGDMMIDHYVVGEIRRLSPEAPVPIVNVVEETYVLGGCGNVVQNLVNFGCQVFATFAIANDEFGTRIYQQLEENKVNFFPILCNQTTVKQRIVDKRTKTQLLRVDREQIQEIKVPTTKEFHDFISQDFDIVIVSDYAKGMVSANLLDILRCKKVIVDPKPKHVSLYRSVYMITPNKQEWQRISTKLDIIDSITNILITEGSSGATLMSKELTRPVVRIPTEEVPVYNVSGAGDVVTSVLAVCLSKGLSVLESSKVAVQCATHSVTLPYTSSISKEVLNKIIQKVLGGTKQC